MLSDFTYGSILVFLTITPVMIQTILRNTILRTLCKIITCISIIYIMVIILFDFSSSQEYITMAKDVTIPVLVGGFSVFWNLIAFGVIITILLL